MAEDKITEKVYCYDHPSAYNNHDALAIAAMAGRHDNNENGMWPMMAMMGGGFGMNQWIAYMMMMMWMRNFNGGWGDGFGGQNAQNIELQNQIQSLRSQLQDNQNTALLRDALGDGFNRNDFALSQLAQNLNVDFNTLQKCCCDVQAAIQQVAGQVGYSAERVINAAQLGDMNIITQLKDCCCQNKELIQRMGYENQLGLKDVQFNTERGFCGLGREVQFGFDRTNTAIERAASAQAYENQKQTCDIINAGNANTQRIIDTLNNHWSDENQRKIQDLKFELSQERQNNLLLSRLGGNNGCGYGYNNGCGQ